MDEAMRTMRARSHDLSPHAVWLAAAIAALAAVLWVPAIVGSRAAAFAQPDGDLAQHLIGARYFFDDAWRWPLLHIVPLGVPDGSNLAMTDSLPLVALVVKLLRPLFGTWPNYFGPWLWLCVALQAAGFATIARALGVRDRWAVLGIGLIGVLTPALLYRTVHIALCSHFLLLFPIAWIWRYLRDPALPLPFARLLACGCIALLVHPYLAAMQATLLVAILLCGLWQDRLPPLRAGLLLAGWLATLTLLAWMCGLAGLALPWGSYGAGSLNLAAPWYPQLSGLFAPDWLVDATGYQYDAYNYWGAGFLVVVALASVLALRHWRTDLNAVHAPLLLVLWALLVYALGYDVCAFDSHVAGVPVGDVIASFDRDDWRGSLSRLLSAHRASLGALAVIYALPVAAFVAFAIRRDRYAVLRFLGAFGAFTLFVLALAPQRALQVLTNFAAAGRFFWVITYTLVPLAFVQCQRHLSRPGFAALLTVAFGLQIADTRPLLDIQQNRFAKVNPAFAQIADLAPRMRVETVVELHPRYDCVQNAFLQLRKTAEWSALSSRYMAWHWLAATVDRPINSVYQARAANRIQCIEQYAHGLPPPTATGTFYVYVDVPGFPHAGDWSGCERREAGLVCVR
jgi:hypothetical protein